MTRASLVWVRNELRVDDHAALSRAVADGGEVAVAFVAEPDMLRASARRSAYLRAAVGGFARSLASRGGVLSVLVGPAPRALAHAVERLDGGAVYATPGVTPLSRRRERAVAAAIGVPLVLCGSGGVHAPGEVVTGAGSAYKVFGPFHRRWLEAGPAEPLDGPDRVHGVAAGPCRALWGDARTAFPATEDDAMRALCRFVDGGLAAYGDGRHRLDGAGSSGLSPALRFGVLSARRAAQVVSEADAEGAQQWLRQLAWRDFAHHAVAGYPSLLARSARARSRWRRAPSVLRAWTDGDTGVPAVDAAMRQLAATGWISNRARMLAASWLVRDERVDWRNGARHFMSTLVDGDPAVNALNWQWVAGTGHEASKPFWRLSPQRQAERYDPSGSWTARWTA